MANSTRFEPLGAEDPPGVPGYPFRARIGAGGMGRVYLSFTPGGRAVAVKVVRPDFAADPEFRRRFQLEITAAQSVAGLYTAPVVDADPGARIPWLATAYIPGPTLNEAVYRHGPMQQSTVWRLLAGAAEGLKAVHAANLVHRDLKPANVLLAADGPRVIDFGIAHAVDATSASLSGKRIGTPAFMAPEQVLNKPPVGPATDVFALGGLALFAASGRPPFGEGNAVFHRIISLAPDLGDCPEALREMIGRCLAKEMSDRPSLDEVIAYARARTAGMTLDYAEAWLPEPLLAVLGDYSTARAPQPPTLTAPQIPVQARPSALAPQPSGEPEHQLRPPLVMPMPAVNQPPRTLGSGKAVMAASLVAVAALILAGAALAVAKPWQHTASAGALNDPSTPAGSPSPAAAGASSPAPPATTPAAPSTAAFDPSSLNDSATDQTPFTAAALLPQTFKDDQNVTFSLVSSGPQDCVASGMAQHVQTVISDNQCSTSMSADYLASGEDIVISIQVFVFPDSADAAQAVAGFAQGSAEGFETWCPTSGEGAAQCSAGPGSGASTWDVHQHGRYLSQALAFDAQTTDRNVTNSAAGAAAGYCGPQVYWGTD
jgi:serine/threonine protein kinase